MTRLSARSHADRIGPCGVLIETSRESLGIVRNPEREKSLAQVKARIWLFLAKQEHSEEADVVRVLCSTSGPIDLRGCTLRAITVHWSLFVNPHSRRTYNSSNMLSQLAELVLRMQECLKLKDY